MEIITSHLNADFDTIGAMTAASKLYPEAVVVLPGTQEESVRGFLVQSALLGLPLRKAKDVDLSTVTRLILVDIRNSSRIGIFKELVKKGGVSIHIYDHHPEEEADIRGEVEVIRPVGASTTILAGILRERGIDVTPDEATVMMLGIYEDTGSLIFPSTTEADYEAAGWLLSKGANLAVVADLLARELTSSQIALLYDFLQGSKVYSIHGVDVTLAEARREEFVGDLAALVHRLRDMEGASVLFALCQMGERVVVVGRSRHPCVDAGAALRDLGGGGHPYAASATLKDVTIHEVRDRLLEALRRRAVRRSTAADLMSSPPRTATARQTMADVARTLGHYNLNALPVLDEGGDVVGIITRQVVEKSIYHKLETETVSEYMNTDFEVVEGVDPVERVQEIIIGKNQRLVPVLSGGRLEGVITRTSLLRHLHEMRSVPAPEEGDELPAPGYYSRPKNVAHLLRERLPETVLSLLRRAGECAEREGMHAFVVGGFVRDLLLRNPNLDVDLVVEGDGIAYARELSAREGGRVRPHQKFGTAVVVLPDGFKVDVATARVEYYVGPAALPTVESSSLRQDLYRRDFTINTLALRLDPGAFGEIIDYFGAQRDLKERVIRILHSLSFVEDPTRILRAARFAERFGFTVSRHTHHLVRNAVRLELVGRLPRPRLNTELELILKEDDPVPIFRRLAEWELGPQIHPSLPLDRGHLERMDETEGVLSWFSLLYLEDRIDPWMVHLLALLDPLGEEEAREFVDELGSVKKVRAVVAAAKGEADRVVREMVTAPVVSRKFIHDLLHNLPVEVILYIMVRSKHPDIKRYISMYFTQLRSVRPLLAGEDLLALGYRPGPLFRRILDSVLEARFLGEVVTREDEEKYVLARFQRP